MSKIKLSLKDFFQVSASGYILNNLVDTLPHGNDGLIFNRISVPYCIGRCDDLIKWKPPHMNSIDFLVVPNQKYDK